MLNRTRSTAIVVGVLGVAAAVAASVATAGQRALPQGSEPVELDPANFSTRIDNPYFPLVPGDRHVFRETDGETRQRVVVSVSKRTKLIADGVVARVVHDRVTERGRVAEDTFDWYAQDSAGNVWYLGEDTVECQNGRVKNHSGSFEAGVDGAQPGVIMPADPVPGLEYRQEYYAGQAEDRAKVLSVDEQAEAPFGHFTDVLLTKDLVPLEPKVSEYKMYARGVGLLLAVTTSGGEGREELLRVEHDRTVKLPSHGKRCSPRPRPRPASIVNSMVNDPFRALSHPIRRGIVENLAGGAATVSEATAGFGVSKPAISKHVKVLEETGVVTRTVEGRTHRLSLEPDALGEAVAWMERQRALWARMFDVVDEYLKEERAK